MSESFKLHRLQQIDSHLDQVRARLRMIETILSDETSIQTAQIKFDEISLAHENAKRAVRKAEENVGANKVKLEQTEVALYGGKVRNPKELQDLQSETEALKRFRSVLDDRLLEAMIIQEDVETAFSAASAELDAARERFSQQNKNSLVRESRLI